MTRPTSSGTAAVLYEATAVRDPRPSTTGSLAGRRASDKASCPSGNGEDDSRPLDIAPAAGRHGGSRSKPKGVLCSARHSSERWKHGPDALQPLSRSFSGHVYSKKMTLGCAPPLSRSKLRARKVEAGRSRRRRETVRSMLPWWQNSTPCLGTTAFGKSSTTEDVDHFARGSEDESCQREDDPCPPTSTAGYGEWKQQQSMIATQNAASTCPVDDEENIVDKRRVDDKSEITSTNLGDRTELSAQRHGDGLQKGAKPYDHYSNLFENPPPSIPTIDQYIFDDNITYKAITKRGHTEAIPVEIAGDDVLHIGQCSDAPRDATFVGGGQGLECNEDPSALLYADEDIDKLLSFFDNMRDADKRVTLEEMILGFRKIRRKWAMVKAEQAGRIVLAKVIRLMGRAEMSLEDWFAFMDRSQNGRGDGKLTALELRSGLERLMTYIARRECSCRAFKCDRMPNYGLPPRTGDAADADAAAAAAATAADCDVAQDTDDALTERQDASSDNGREGYDAGLVCPGYGDSSRKVDTGFCMGGAKGADSAAKSAACIHGAIDSGSPARVIAENWGVSRGSHDGSDKSDGGRKGVDSPTAENERTPGMEEGEADHTPCAGGQTSAPLEQGKVEGQEGEDVKGACTAGTRRISMDAVNAGRAVVCRAHALEGMVYLGQRAYFQGLESQHFTSKEVSDLMRFIDTDVNFTLDIEEMRRAISRLQAKADDEEEARTSEAGHLLQVLEEHMHRTGARFTDVFFLLDRNRNGYIEKEELRTLFQQLSREPARREGRARARAELAEEKKRQMNLREAEARESAERLEVYKKAGAYPVLKRIEVWQARTGKRLSDGFQAGGGDRGAGNRGLDVDELAAFMHNLNLDLSPAEAMLLMRHLDGGQNGLVEIKEVVAAVRNIRRYETIIKAAQKHGISLGGSGGGRKHLAGESMGGHGAALDGARGAGVGGIGGGAEYLWECSETYRPAGFASPLEKPFPDGPSVFRPPLEIITHGRAWSAPARGRQIPRGNASTGRRPVTAATAAAAAAAAAVPQCRGGAARSGGAFTSGTNGDTSLESAHFYSTKATEKGIARTGREIGSAGAPFLGAGGGGILAREGGSTRGDDPGRVDGGGTPAVDANGMPQHQQHQQGQRVPSQRSPRRAAPRGGHGRSSHEGGGGGDNGVTDTGGSARAASTTKTTSTAAASSSAASRNEPTPSWVLGLRAGLDGRGGWWPGAMSAAEDGARLDIYTGSVLDGRWLHSLDSRLSATMRATRR